MAKSKYPPSIIQQTNSCFLCGKSNLPLHHHHCFNNNPMRKKTNDCWVWLCEDCHYKLHNSGGEWEGFKMHLKRTGQVAYMKKYGWSLAQWFEFSDKSFI